MAASGSNIIMSTIGTAGDRGVGILFLLPSNRPCHVGGGLAVTDL
jgi:hypothetical protein